MYMFTYKFDFQVYDELPKKQKEVFYYLDKEVTVLLINLTFA